MRTVGIAGVKFYVPDGYVTRIEGWTIEDNIILEAGILERRVLELPKLRWWEFKKRWKRYKNPGPSYATEILGCTANSKDMNVAGLTIPYNNAPGEVYFDYPEGFNFK